MRGIYSMVRTTGAGTTLRQGLAALRSPYVATMRDRRLRTPEDYARLDPTAVEGGPEISVLVPAYETPPAYLDAAIRSVRDQVYPRWQLVLVDDRSPSEAVREVIARHAGEDDRIEAVFRETNGNISAALNSGLEKARGPLMTVLDHDDLLDPSALYRVAEAVLAHPDASYVYSDEDKVDAEGRHVFGAYFKPDWSPEYMLAMMYTCHLSAFRTDLVRELGGFVRRVTTSMGHEAG